MTCRVISQTFRVIRRPVLPVTAFRSFVLCAAVAGLPVQPAASPAALLDQLMRADNAGDLEAVLRLYAGDAVLLPPGEPAVSGADAIRQRYRQMFATARLNVRFVIDAESAAGDLAWIRGRTMGTRGPTDGAPPGILAHKFVMLLRRQDGAWRIAVLIWNAGTT